MSRIDLKLFAEQLPQDWKSQSVGLIGETNIRVLRMNGSEIPEEAHPYAEALLVVDGVLNLTVNQEDIQLKDGQVYFVPAHTRHKVKAGSSGTLLLISPA
ncbi:MAG: cupin domain-containing protein [Pseudobdellovibrionaceae bacterium]|nr:cupin domain-containing protein [Pseudobdellovibrionaceae bacterium]